MKKHLKHILNINKAGLPQGGTYKQQVTELSLKKWKEFFYH